MKFELRKLIVTVPALIIGIPLANFGTQIFSYAHGVLSTPCPMYAVCYPGTYYFAEGIGILFTALGTVLVIGAFVFLFSKL